MRGATNAILTLEEESKKKGIITHSSGNHAQALALAGKLLGIKTTVVMPKNSPTVKLKKKFKKKKKSWKKKNFILFLQE